MEVTDRVHVLAIGGERSRIVDPLFDLKADVAVLLTPTDTPLAAFEQELLDRLDGIDRLQLVTIGVDRYDFERSLQAFTRAITAYEDQDVYLNVTPGTAITSVAAMLAAQTTGATPYVVQPADARSASDPEGPAAGEITELPVLDVQGPSDEQLRVLAFLYCVERATKKELIQFGTDQQLPFIAATESSSREGCYRLLESHIVEPLASADYIEVRTVGREKYVAIDRRGVVALSAFPLDPAVIEQLHDRQPETFADPWDLVGPPVDRHTTISDGFTDHDAFDDEE